MQKNKFKEVYIPDILKLRFNSFEDAYDYLEKVNAKCDNELKWNQFEAFQSEKKLEENALNKMLEIYKSLKIEQTKLTDFLMTNHHFLDRYNIEISNKEEKEKFDNNIKNWKYNLILYSEYLSKFSYKLNLKIGEIIYRLGIREKTMDRYIDDLKEKIDNEKFNVDFIEPRIKLLIYRLFRSFLNLYIDNNNAKKEETNNEKNKNIKEAHKALEERHDMMIALIKKSDNANSKINKLKSELKSKYKKNTDNPKMLDLYLEKEATEKIIPEVIIEKAKLNIKYYKAEIKINNNAPMEKLLKEVGGNLLYKNDEENIIIYLESLFKELEDTFNPYLSKGIKKIYDELEVDEKLSEFSKKYSMDKRFLQVLYGDTKTDKTKKEDKKERVNNENKNQARNFESIYDNVYTLDFEEFREDLNKLDLVKKSDGKFKKIVERIFKDQRVFIYPSKIAIASTQSAGSGYIFTPTKLKPIIIHELGHYVDFKLSGIPYFAIGPFHAEYYSQIFEMDYRRSKASEDKNRALIYISWILSFVFDKLNYIAVYRRLENLALKEIKTKETTLDEEIEEFASSLTFAQAEMFVKRPFNSTGYKRLKYVIPYLMSLVTYTRIKNEDNENDEYKRYIDGIKLNKWLTTEDLLKFMDIDLYGEELKNALKSELEEFLDKL